MCVFEEKEKAKITKFSLTSLLSPPWAQENRCIFVLIPKWDVNCSSYMSEIARYQLFQKITRTLFKYVKNGWLLLYFQFISDSGISSLTDRNNLDSIAKNYYADGLPCLSVLLDDSRQSVLPGQGRTKYEFSQSYHLSSLHPSLAVHRNRKA